MSQQRKVEVSFRVTESTVQRATADASRRGCTLERWAEEVFAVFAERGFYGALPPQISDRAGAQ